MKFHHIRFLISRDLFVICSVIALTLGYSQMVPAQQPPTGADDVVRINTELVQTDVMVFDKKGRFVPGLKADSFELKVDKKPQSIAFFEELASGSEKQVRAPQRDAESRQIAPTAARAGRTLIFFIDDLHLAPDSLVRTRKALLEFINGGMSANDQVAITSSSGQIGFLQQFTDDRAVLTTAVSRLSYRADAKTDMEAPPMSEFAASQIRDGDESAITFYVQEIMKQNCLKTSQGIVCMMSAQSARQVVLQRARQIVTEAAPNTNNTLRLLEGLMRSAAQLPGRKLVFLISDGFYLNDKRTGSQDRIRRVTEAAGKAGVVIYTLDARGLISEGLEVTNNRPVESGGLLAPSMAGEILASQDGLNALARDTGGRAFRNTNRPMSEWVDDVLEETSNYYLLAWRPDTDEEKRRKFNHIQITVKGWPDLNVRLRGAYFKTAPLPILDAKRKPDKDPGKAREDDMRLVIDAPVSQLQLPTTVTLGFTQVPGVGTKLAAAIEISREGLTFDLIDGKQAADVDIGGILYDDKGKPVSSFVGRLRIFAVNENSSQARRPAVYRFQAWARAGLYQVRVGVRDIKSGKIGSAMQWIKLPSLPSN
ncbi:MAG: VWA domain-containing protein [Acidobacteriota bacterium]